MAMQGEKLERQLDAALARYAAAEPREGLEQRVLANLRTEPEIPRVWWRSASVFATAVAIAAILLVWGVAHHRARIGSVVSPARQMAQQSTYLEQFRMNTKLPDQRGERFSRHAETSERIRQAKNKDADVALAKLTQFPAPEPLTDQEKLLLQFVQDEPGEAALVAQAQTEALQRKADEMKAFGSKTDSLEEER